MKLLLVSPDLRLMGGVSETVKLLLRGLDGQVEVTTAIFGRRFGQVGYMRLFRMLFDLFSFARLLIFRRFDVIHMNPSMNLISVLKETSLFLLFWLFGYSGKILIFIHGWNQEFFEDIVSRRVTAFFLRAVLNRAGQVLVLADDFRDELIRAGVMKSKIQVVSTMVDLDSVPNFSGCDSGENSLLFMSRMITGKGGAELIEAFSLLNTRYAGLKLIMAGDGPERGRLMALAESLSLSNVSFVGYVQGDEKRRVLEESCIFILPSVREGCPVSLLEAMASGLVPVVTSVGGVNDVIIPEHTAVTLSELSAEAIAETLERLLDNSVLRRQIAINARRYARKNFGFRQVSARIQDLYFRIY